MSPASRACAKGALLELDLVGEHTPPKSRHYNGECNSTKGKWQHEGLDDGNGVVGVANKAIGSSCTTGASQA